MEKVKNHCPLFLFLFCDKTVIFRLVTRGENFRSRQEILKVITGVPISTEPIFMDSVISNWVCAPMHIPTCALCRLQKGV